MSKFFVFVFLVTLNLSILGCPAQHPPREPTPTPPTVAPAVPDAGPPPAQGVDVVPVVLPTEAVTNPTPVDEPLLTEPPTEKVTPAETVPAAPVTTTVPVAPVTSGDKVEAPPKKDPPTVVAPGVPAPPVKDAPKTDTKTDAKPEVKTPTKPDVKTDPPKKETGK